MLKLSEIKLNKEYTIIENNSKDLLKERLLCLGFVYGSKISLLKKSKTSIYLIKGMMIALRNEEADYIWVK